jgi:hypothetical protein
MCTLLDVLAILHIMQDVNERTAFLELLDSYVGNIPALEKIFLSELYNRQQATYAKYV